MPYNVGGAYTRHGLVVDNNNPTIRLTAKVLRGLNCTVTGFTNGRDTLAYLADRNNPRPHLIFIKIRGLGCTPDGHEVARILRTQAPFIQDPVLQSTPIIGFTAMGLLLQEDLKYINDTLRDYCDVYLTHDSMSVRKAHNSGRNHLRNVVEYYQQIGQEKAQSVIDSITSSYAAEGQAVPNPAMVPPGAYPPPFGFPGQLPPPPFGIPPPGPGGAPGMPPPPGGRGLPFPPPFPPASGAPGPGGLPPLPNMPNMGPPGSVPPPGQFPPPPGGFPPIPPNFQGGGAPGFPPMPGAPGPGPAGFSPSPGPGVAGPPGGGAEGFAPQPGMPPGAVPGPPPGLGDQR